MPIDELAPVIRIHPAHGEGEVLGDGRQRLQNPVLPFAPHGLPLHPARVNVHGIERVQELARRRGSGVGYEINFQIPGLRHVPMIHLERHQMFQQGARPGGPIEPALQPVFARLQAPIDLPGTDGEQVAGHGGRQGPPLPDPREPDRQGRLQPRRTQIARLLPDPGQHADGLGTVSRAPVWDAPGATPGGLPARQQPNGILPVIATHPCHFIQERRARHAVGPLIPVPHHRQILLLRSSRHATRLHPHPPSAPHHAGLEGKICK